MMMYCTLKVYTLISRKNMDKFSFNASIKKKEASLKYFTFMRGLYIQLNLLIFMKIFFFCCKVLSRYSYFKCIERSFKGWIKMLNDSERVWKCDDPLLGKFTWFSAFMNSMQFLTRVISWSNILHKSSVFI